MSQWTNWSGRIRAEPSQQVSPRDVAEVVDVIAQARRSGGRVRARGTGHSNTGLCATNDVLVGPEGLTGVVAVAPDRRSVRVRSGTVLGDLAAALFGEGLALHNLGDIDVQTVGGAVATATHGTGPALGNLATAVRAAQVCLADGSVVDTSPTVHADLFAALLPSLGSMGIVTEFEFAVVESYLLHERIGFGAGDDVLAGLDERIAATRHYEFFWYPHRDLAEHKSLAVVDGAPDPLPDRRRERIDHWHQVLPSRRDVRFNEMEYSVPAEAGPACFAALRERMLTRWSDVQWPVEYRTVAADDLWLSPHHGRASVTISVHQGAELPCDELFADTERVLLEHDGRPHWGKVHTCTGAELRDRYPDWERWWETRDRLDPDGLFLNDYVQGLRA